MNNDKLIEQWVKELARMRFDSIKQIKQSIVVCEVFAARSGPITGIGFVRLIRQWQHLLTQYGETCY